MQKKNLTIYDTPEKLAHAFADSLMAQISEFQGIKFHLAISGGKTPNLLFEVLASKFTGSKLWPKVHFWWVDERMVEPTHPESNFGVAQKLLFSQVAVPEINIHRIKGENNPETEALSYSNLVRNNLPLKNGWPVFDLILLGMGNDGHTASIFPNQMDLLNSDKVCEVATHPVSGQKRVTLTGKAINSASKICFLVTGEDKAECLKEVFNSEKQAILPASFIKNAHWIMDKSAAQLID